MKFGFSKEEVLEQFADIKDLKNIEVVGLMNMTPLGADEKESSRLFRELGELRDELERVYNCKLKELSMGMSQDYIVAAREGSTMLRIGRRLFR